MDKKNLDIFLGLSATPVKKLKRKGCIKCSQEFFSIIFPQHMKQLGIDLNAPSQDQTLEGQS